MTTIIISILNVDIHMAYVEKQRHGRHDYYYLVKSVRAAGGKVKKARIFMGRKMPAHGKLQELFARLERKAAKPRRARLLSRETVERLDDIGIASADFKALSEKGLPEDFLVRFTYNTNAIEGNPLTLRQTALILNDGIAPQGARANDVMEVYNGKDAWEFVKGYKGAISPLFLRKAQYQVTKNTACRIQGRFRDSEVRISGSAWVPPKAAEVPALVERLAREVREARRTMHPLELAAHLHNRIAQIHPFTDGNGRTARLMMNKALMAGGLPPVIIDARNKEEYYSMIEKADKGDGKPFAEFLARQVIGQYTKRE